MTGFCLVMELAREGLLSTGLPGLVSLPPTSSTQGMSPLTALSSLTWLGDWGDGEWRYGEMVDLWIGGCRDWGM